MATTPGQLVAQLRERFTPAADAVEAEIEAAMKSLTSLDPDGSFEFKCGTPANLNPTVLAILNERYGRPDNKGWRVLLHEPDLIEMIPQVETPR